MSNEQSDLHSRPAESRHTAETPDIGSEMLDVESTRNTDDPVIENGSALEPAFTPVAAVKLPPEAVEPCASDGPADAGVGDVVEFRVTRTGTPPRRLRLTGRRYTFGSGEECTIRLEDESLRSTHAVLIRDAQRLLMRAYSVPIECNGQKTSEAGLRIGDVIGMGSYRFELLSCPVVAGTQNQTGLPAFDSDSTEMLQRREQHLREQDQSLREREQALEQREAEAERARGEFESVCRDLEAMKHREAEVGETLLEKESELAEAQRQVTELKAELEEREARWQQNREDYQRQAAEAEQKLQDTRRQAEAAGEAVAKMRGEFASIGGQLDELKARHQELQQRESQAQSEHERLRGDLEAARDQAIDAKAESEAARGQLEDELRQLHQQLECTRAELQQVRVDSQHCQDQLGEKLRQTCEELTEARVRADEASSALTTQHAAQDERIRELENELQRAFQEQQGEEAAIQQQIDELRLQCEQAEQGRGDAERHAESLQQEIQRLQSELASATDEVSRLRTSQEAAQASICQLELLVDHQHESQEQEPGSWAAESQQLQKTIEELSLQLAAAHSDLNELRITNEALRSELGSPEQESSAAASHPEHNDLFEAVQKQLESARGEIERLGRDHAETLARLQSEREQSEAALRQEIESLKEQIATAQQIDASQTASSQTVSGDSVWRVEAEQSAEHHSHLDSWGPSAWDSSNADPATWDHEPASESAPPEEMVTGAIDEIQQHLQEAIGEANDREEPSVHSGLPTDVPDVESEWAAYLSPPKEPEASAADGQATQRWGHLDAVNPAEQEPSDEQSVEPSPELGDAQPPEAVSQSADLPPADEEPPADELPADGDTGVADANEPGDSQSVGNIYGEDAPEGSLAEMLIRDLSGESEPSVPLEDEATQSFSGEPSDPPAAGDEPEDQPTFLMSDSPALPADPSLEESQQWSDVASQRDDGDPVDVIPESDAIALDAVGNAPDDDSIEAYMNRLLQRVHPQTDAQQPPAPTNPDAGSQATNISPSDESGRGEPVGAEAAQSQDADSEGEPEPARMVPRSQAPELKKNFSEMRELANQSARIAVARSIRLQARDTQMKAMMKMALMLSFVAMGVFVYLFVNWSQTIKVTMIGAFAVLAIVFTQEAYVLFRDARRRHQLAEESLQGGGSDDRIADELQRIAQSDEA